MKVLLVSSTARGHAVAEAIVKSPYKPELISVCASANPGIKRIASEMHVQDVMDFYPIVNIANETKPDFAFIGPDDPIGKGLADVLEDAGVPCVAPKQSLARAESSKGFLRNLLKKCNIDVSPKFEVFRQIDPPGIKDYIEQELNSEYVVKYDALKGGKGVKVSGEHIESVKDGVEYAIECIDECGAVVIEEKLIGVEFSLMSFVSGTQVVHMPAVQDHKRAYEHDTGPNTGGMGTWSDADHSLPFLTDEDLESAKQTNILTAKALMKECGEPFKGILYGGFIVTRRGVKLIEYNCRLGDPEALNVLPILKSDFVDICLGIVNGELTDDLAHFENKATVCKYITPESYPVSKDQKGELVTIPEIPNHSDAAIYYGDLSEDSEGALHLGGSRSVGIVGIGPTIEDAENLSEELCQKVQGPVRYRCDIGTKPLIAQRLEAVKSLR